MDYSDTSTGIAIVTYLFSFAFSIFFIVCMWKIYVKAGKPGWTSIIPIYNYLVMFEFLGRPWYWLLLLLVPGVNIVIGILMMLDLAKVFGKSTGFAMGLLFLSFIFYPILAFGDAQYVGPIATQNSVAGQPLQ